MALGLEAPLCMALPNAPDDLVRSRSVDGSHSMWASAGTSVALIGVQELAWLVDRLPRRSPIWFDPDDLGPGGQVLVWEAFVSGEAHDRGDNSHVRDAELAVEEFITSESPPSPPIERAVLNLAAASCLRHRRVLVEAMNEAPAVVKPEVGDRGWMNRELRSVRMPTADSPTGPLTVEDSGRLRSKLAERGIRALVGGASEVPARGYNMSTVRDGAFIATATEQNLIGLLRQEGGEVWIELPPGNWLSRATGWI